jgi:hypothetical protein
MLNYIEALIMAVPSSGDLSKCLKIQESGTTNLAQNKTHSGYPHLNHLPD